MTWWPRQTPSSGVVGPQARTRGMLIPAGAGGDDDAVGGGCQDLAHRCFVAADDLDVAAVAEEQVRQVVGEGVVVVDEENHGVVAGPWRPPRPDRGCPA